MKKYALLLPLVGLCLIASSCFQQHIEISLNKDGSGTVTEETTLGAQVLQMMAGAPGGADEALAGMVEEAKTKAAARAKVMGAGVELKSVEAINKGGGKGTLVTYTFKDINDLRYSPDTDMGGGGGGEPDEVKEPEQPLKFSYQDGTLTMINKDEQKDAPDDPAEGEDDREMGDQELAMAKQMLGDMRISLKMNFPGGLAKTNASHVDGNKATIMDMQIGKILEQPEKFKEMNKAKPETPAEMLEILDGVEGVVIEPEEKVTFTLK